MFPSSSTCKVAAPLLLLGCLTISVSPAPSSSSYGIQCSFPIVDRAVDGCDQSLLGQRQDFYEQYMEGCHDEYGEEACQEQEQQRLDMNRRQPQSMVNFTAEGFRKVPAPESLVKILKEFWETNRKHIDDEEWPEGNIYTNHWAAPTFMVNVEDSELEGGGPELKNAIWDAAKGAIEEWTGGAIKLRPSSLYGIRVYQEGAVLSPHVDRIPLISSAIINVDQDVDEPWPLEVYDRFGNAVNVTMNPGDMVLYESHSLIHGRPFPLKGRYMANIFIHFEPFDVVDEDAENAPSAQLGPGGDLPPYVLPDSPEAKHWRQQNPDGWSKYQSEADELLTCNEFAAHGLLGELKKMGELDKRILNFADDDGWRPLHEAVYAGHLEIVKYLVENGVSINARTGEDEDGQSPLNIAKLRLGSDHEVSKFLASLGALDIEKDPGDPEEEEEYEDEDEEEEDDEDYEDEL